MLAKRLRAGSRVGVVAPSSPVTPETKGQLASGISFLQGLELEVVVGEHVFWTTLGYSASPLEKAADINAMFADDAIDGIICAQGGATANACLPYLSWPTIRTHPKVFMGMSDITVLLNAIHATTGLVTFHGDDVLWGFGRTPTDYDRGELVRTLLAGRPATIAANGERRTIRGGRCEGIAVGGNLRCLLKLAGTPFLPETDGAVLFLEAVGASCEDFDYQFHQLEQMGVLGKISGAVVGHVDGLPDDDGLPQVEGRPQVEGLQGGTGPTTMEDVLRTVGADRDFPILKVNDFGHNCPNTVLPIGARVRVDADRQTIEQVEAFIA